MTQHTTLAKHAALVDDMGHALGVDLEEEVLRGSVTPDRLVDAVLSCTNCTDPTRCRAWLDGREGIASATPDYCRNDNLFEGLRAVVEKR
jgi:hypothetical protein